MKYDILTEMFKKQIQLQQLLNNDITSQEFKQTNILASIDELCEVLRTTPWKPWKKNQKLDIDNFKEELIDVFHFIINLSLSVNMTPEELYLRFCNKNKENINRQKRGY